MDEIKVVLETQEKDEPKKGIWRDVLLGTFFGTILIPAVGFYVSYVMKDQEIKAKEFELAIKILESNKQSEPAVKEWAKKAFKIYAKVEPSEEVLKSLDSKPFIYDELDYETDKVSVAMFPLSGSIFSLVGSNLLNSSIAINSIEIFNSSNKRCYSHKIEFKSHTPKTSFQIGEVTAEKLMECFNGAIFPQDNIDLLPVDDNSIDAIKVSYDSIEKLTLILSWSSEDKLLSVLTDEYNPEPNSSTLLKSYYLAKRKK